MRRRAYQNNNPKMRKSCYNENEPKHIRGCALRAASCPLRWISALPAAEHDDRAAHDHRNPLRAHKKRKRGGRVVFVVNGVWQWLKSKSPSTGPGQRPAAEPTAGATEQGGRAPPPPSLHKRWPPSGQSRLPGYDRRRWRSSSEVATTQEENGRRSSGPRWLIIYQGTGRPIPPSGCSRDQGRGTAGRGRGGARGSCAISSHAPGARRRAALRAYGTANASSIGDWGTHVAVKQTPTEPKEHASDTTRPREGVATAILTTTGSGPGGWHFACSPLSSPPAPLSIYLRTAPSARA